MAKERTLTILKPDCVRKGLIGEVTKRIQEAGFEIVAMKMTRLTKDTAGGFYAVHKERPFYDELCEFMSSGACVPMILEKENAIADFRELIGATNMTLSIRDVSGKLIRSMSGSFNKIAVGDLTPGLYFLQVNKDEKIYQSRFLVERP